MTPPPLKLSCRRDRTGAIVAWQSGNGQTLDRSDRRPLMEGWSPPLNDPAGDRHVTGLQ
jgi:hypothetical protein